MKKNNFWRQRSTKILLLISLILVVLCMIPIFRPDRSYLFEGDMLFTEGVPEESVPVYQGIQLPPGVYRVELAYSCDTDGQNLCRVQDGTVFANGLLTGGEHFYSGASETSFDMWLFERADAIQVLVDYNGTGVLETGSLKICETNHLWTICITVIIFLTVLILAVQWIRFYDREYTIRHEDKNVFLSLAVLAVIASIPYLTGTVPAGADLGYHLLRIEGIKEGILAGQFPVRLEPQWIYGHGYANGIFYCGTLLVFPALLRLIGFPVTFSYSCYCIAINIATIWISYYAFSRIFKDKYIGVAGSALYTISVFRIYRVVIVAAVGEGSALTFLPLILYGFWRAFTEDRQSRTYRTVWIPLAAGYAGLIQTHVLSCEITAFLTVLICLIFIRRVLCRETFLELCKGAAGALLLSIWFLVPFLDYFRREDLHVRHVWARTIQDRGLYPAQLLFQWWRKGENPLFGESGMWHSDPAGLGFVLILGFLAFGMLWFSGRLKGTENPIWKLGKAAWGLGGLLMLMSLESFPWDRIQSIHKAAAAMVSSLQFPYRFLGWGTVFCVLLCCCVLRFLKEKEQKLPYFIGVLGVLVGIATSGMYLLDHVCRDQGQLVLYNEENMGFGYISGGEYLVEGTKTQGLFFQEPHMSENVQIREYEKGALRAEFICGNQSSQEGYVELPLLHYYGYQASGEGYGRLAVCKGENNLVRVTIPPGCDMRVSVRFVSPWYWRAAEGVSYVWAVVMLLLCLRYRRRGLYERIPETA